MPKSRIIFCLFATLLTVSWAKAGVFKWIDAQGNIHYSDKKPENQQSEEIEIKAHTPDLSYQNKLENNPSADSKQTDKPYNKKHKVTMYSASWCGYCKKARAYFQDNKILFTEYDIEKNSQAKRRYEQLGGSGVPLLVAKRKQMQGFSKPRFERWYNDLWLNLFSYSSLYEDIKMLRLIVILFLTIGLYSCGEAPSDSEQNNIKTVNKEHMLSDQQKMIQKAKDTEKLIHEADEKRRKALEDQGG